MACGDVLSLEDLQTAKKHQIFEAEVITGKVGGIAGGATIGTATNPVTGQTQQTLPSILADLGFDVQPWTSSTGGVLASANQVFLNDTPGSLGLGDYYAWGGTFPKTVPAGTDPALVGSGYIMRHSRLAGVQAREALRRSYAEAGYNLVAGSFEAGGVLVSANDALLQERTGKAFTGPAGTVAAGTNPASVGFVDRSDALNRTFANVDAMLTFNGLVAGQRYSTGGTTWEYLGGGGLLGSFKPLNDIYVTDFGADGSGDDTQAFNDAGAFGVSVYCPKLSVPYKVSTIETTTSVTYYGGMDGTTTIETIGGVNNPMFFNRATGRKLAIVDLALKGSGLNGVGTGTPHFRGVGIWCSAGELKVTGCTISMFSSHAILTGNISDNWDINAYVDRCDIHHNVIEQGDIALGLGDCMRLERTNNLSVTHNECSGGLSGIRSQLFCKDVEISHNHVYGSYADVGITVAHSSDVMLSHNDCHSHHGHGMEVDSSYRVKVDNNKCHQNGKRGILVSEYKTPSKAWYAGYLDGALIAPAQNVWPDLNDISNNMCFNNGESGLHIISPSRCTVSSNKFWNNCRLNAAFTSHILVGTSVDSGYAQDVALSWNEYTNSALCSAGLSIDSYQYDSLLPVTAHNNVLTNGGLLSRQPTYGSSNKIKFGEPLERFAAGYLTPIQNQGLNYKHGYSWRLLDLADPGQKSLTFNVSTVPFVRRLLARVKFSGVSSTCRLIVQEYFVDAAGVETFKRTLSNTTFASTSSIGYRSAYVDSTANNDYNAIKVQFVTDDDAGATVDVHDLHLSWVE